MMRILKKCDKSIGLRIRTLRKRLGLNQTGFGKRFGVTQEAVSAWEHGAYPDGLSLLKIAKAGETDVEWILTGNSCRCAGAPPQKTLDSEKLDEGVQTKKNYELCPLLHHHVISGPPKEIQNQDIAESLWVPSIISGKEVYLMQVRDNAMEPIFKKEDIVAIREWTNDVGALKGLIVAAWHPKDGLITRWLSPDQDCWILHPENRGHPVVFIEKKENIRIFRVIWWWGNQK